jgi:hypothetical protein
MNIMRKAVSASGGILLAALLVAAFAPKVTRGIATALVQVANTAANPAMTQDTSKQVSQIVELTCGAATQQCTQLLPDAPLPSTGFTVPTGQTLVVTDIEFESVDNGDVATFQIAYQIPPGATLLKSWSAAGNGATAEFSLGPGFGIAAGDSIGVVEQFNTVGERAIMRGYLTSN